MLLALLLIARVVRFTILAKDLDSGHTQEREDRKLQLREVTRLC